MEKAEDTISTDETTERLAVQGRAGNRGAFDELVRRYQMCAMKTAVRILGNADEAAEAVQEGFVAAYLKIKQLQDPAKFGPWLMRIMANCAIERQRACIRRRQRLRHAADVHGRAVLHRQGGEADELCAALASAMEKLTPMQARAMALFGIEELSHQEAAEAMGCSPEAARGHVYQARKKLRVLLKAYLE